MVSAIIAAAGVGKRLGANVPKAFVQFKNMPLLAYTTKFFEENNLIDEIIWVVPKDFIDVAKDIQLKYNFNKVKAIVEGGATRQESVYNGLKMAKGEIVMIHDAARPLLTDFPFEKMIRLAEEKGAVVPVAPLTETLKFISREKVLKTIPRENLFCAKTPQCFKRELILKAHERARHQKKVFTDDATLVEDMGEEVYAIEVSTYNIKITTQEDLKICEKLCE